jgi:hypothetical protein
MRIATAGILKAGIATAGILIAGIATAGILRAGIATAGILIAGIATAGNAGIAYMQFRIMRQRAPVQDRGELLVVPHKAAMGESTQ